MSIEAMAHVLNVKVGHPTRKLILIARANHAHKDGKASWVDLGVIADYAECDVRTVQRHTAWLLEQGYLREGDQQLVAHLPHYKRPIVYDVAMSEATRRKWAADNTPGRRAAAAAHGATGGRKSAAARKAAKAADHASASTPPGDNLTPDTAGAPGDNLSPGHPAPPGDNLTPGPGDNLSPHTGDKLSPPPGDTHDTPRVTPVSPKPSLEPSVKPPPPTSSTSAPQPAGAGTQVVVEDTHPNDDAWQRQRDTEATQLIASLTLRSGLSDKECRRLLPRIAAALDTWEPADLHAHLNATPGSARSAYAVLDDRLHPDNLRAKLRTSRLSPAEAARRHAAKHAQQEAAAAAADRAAAAIAACPLGCGERGGRAQDSGAQCTHDPDREARRKSAASAAMAASRSGLTRAQRDALAERLPAGLGEQHLAEHAV